MYDGVGKIITIIENFLWMFYYIIILFYKNKVVLIFILILKQIIRNNYTIGNIAFFNLFYNTKLKVKFSSESVAMVVTTYFEMGLHSVLVSFLLNKNSFKPFSAAVDKKGNKTCLMKHVL